MFDLCQERVYVAHWFGRPLNVYTFRTHASDFSQTVSNKTGGGSPSYAVASSDLGMVQDAQMQYLQ